MTKSPLQTPAPAGPSRKRGATRERLLDAGLVLFSERGFDGTSVKDLEAAVGLTPGRGSFYRHFPDKEALMEAVVRREIDRVRERGAGHRPARDAAAEPRETLITEVRETLQGLRGLEALIRILGREYGQGRFPELMQRVRTLLIDESVGFSGERYARAMADGTLRSLDPEALSAILLSAVVGYHLASLFFEASPAGIDRERFAAGLADLMLADWP